MRCLVCKVSLQQSCKDQPESPRCCLKATGRAAARDPVKDSVMRLPRWACIRAVCHAPFRTYVLSPLVSPNSEKGLSRFQHLFSVSQQDGTPGALCSLVHTFLEICKKTVEFDCGSTKPK